VVPGLSSRRRYLARDLKRSITPMHAEKELREAAAF